VVPVPERIAGVGGRRLMGIFLERGFRGDGVEFRRPLEILCQILAHACFSRTWIALFQFRSVGCDFFELKETLIPANFGAGGF